MVTLEHRSDAPHAHLVGGGIASLAAAALLLQHGRMSGDRIHIYEQSALPGGAMDGSGSAETGYLIRGGRMFEPHYACTYDLFQRIPSAVDPQQTVTQELQAFTRQVVTSSRCRIVSQGQRIDGPPLQLSGRDRRDLLRLAVRRESALAGRTIDSCFSPPFFETNFWVMWSTMFSFQPWHSLQEFRRYMHRFMHLLPGFNRLEGIGRTPLNQYDSMIAPLVTWLQRQGVTLHPQTQVTHVEFQHRDRQSAVSGLQLLLHGQTRQVSIRPDDLVFMTLGSMTDAARSGSMETAPDAAPISSAPSWSLWHRIAQQSPLFGRPQVFCSQPEHTRWESFTVTLPDSRFFDFMQTFTGNSAGTGGLVTFRDSAWLLSVVLAYQPHFRNQPPNVRVFWGYGLYPDRPGNSVAKRMTDCSGREILSELFHHLRQDALRDHVLDHSTCIPCLMPYITSQFMPRNPGDRPAVVPSGATNFAFIGQFCEIPRETAFTVEYSIRSAYLAVRKLVQPALRIPPLFRGDLRPSVLLQALPTLWR